MKWQMDFFSLMVCSDFNSTARDIIIFFVLETYTWNARNKWWNEMLTTRGHWLSCIPIIWQYFTVTFRMSSASPGQMYWSLGVLWLWVLIAGGWTESGLSFCCPPPSSLLSILFPGLPRCKTVTSSPTPPPLLNTHKDMGVIGSSRVACPSFLARLL